MLVMLVMSVSMWGFIQLADEVREGETQASDEWVIRCTRQADDPSVPIGSAWLVRAVQDVTALGSVTVLFLVFAAVVGYFVLQRAYGAVWLVVITTLGGIAPSVALKFLFGRERPDIVPHLAVVHGLSFPIFATLLPSGLSFLKTLGIGNVLPFEPSRQGHAQGEYRGCPADG